MTEQKIAEDVARLVELREKAREIEQELESVRKRIQETMAADQVYALSVGGYRVVIMERESSRLSADKLVALGVSPAVIEQATSRTRYTVLDVRKEKQR